jgi:hypothetical protein
MTRVLGREAGGDGASAEDLAEASGRLLDRLSERLSIVIGRAGVDALVLRAVKLRNPEFPFLDERTVVGDSGRAGDGLRARLQGQDADVISEVSITLFTTFAGLLAAIIGERLAWGLLCEVWPETLRADIGVEEADP